jgi:parallel beta-helix repeat protein
VIVNRPVIIKSEISFATRTEAAGSTLNSAYTTLRTGGYTTLGIGAAWHKRTNTLPSHGGYFQSADASGYWEIAETEQVTPQMFGAKGDGSTDDTVAIQAALDYIELTRVPLYFPTGTYMISSTLTVDPASDRTFGVKLLGTGKAASEIKASAAMTAMISFPADDAADRQERLLIDGLGLDGNALAEKGYYSNYAAHSTFRNFRVKGTTTAAVSWGGGFCNVYDDLELVNNTGDGLYLAEPEGQNNAIVVSGCKIFNNSGFGIVVQSSSSLDIHGNTIEANEAGGVYARATTALNLAANYFEFNGETGHTFTSPESLTIKADIILNGTTTDTTISGAFPCSAATIHGNFAQTETGKSDIFIFAPGSDGLVVDGNTLHTDASAMTLLRGYGNPAASAAVSNGWLRDVTVGTNSGFDEIIEIDPFTFGALNYSTRSRYVRSVYAKGDNLAETDLNRWSNVVSSNGGTWERSSTAFPADPNVPVWNLVWATATASHLFGFSINTANYPEHHGKPFVFACWTKHPFAGDGNAWVYANSLALTASNDSVTDWTFQSGVFVFPASGTKFFALRKNGAAGTIQIARPVLCEFGADIDVLMGRMGKQTVFSGTAAPTAGTWLKGDVVMNSSPSVGSPDRWVCTTAGTPGTWTATANL